MRRFVLFIFCISISMHVFASSNLLIEYNNEINHHLKMLKMVQKQIEPFADKQMNNQQLTDDEYEKFLMLSCHGKVLVDKVQLISGKPKYKNLEKAQKIKKLAPKIKQHFLPNDRECNSIV